ncbi:MAG: 5'-nucleotidase C-terminal domain-containing protein [Fusobacterium sp.]|nr:5'-nucleotidase C-terminal domain-containing protein [Fusobacterium sp.]
MVYFNDMHGSLSFIDSFVTARDEFYRKNTEGTNWTVSGGDMFIKGSDNNPVVAKFIDKYVDAIGVGNHDISNAKDFTNLIEKAKIAHKFLSANMEVDSDNELAGQIAKSTIITDGDERIGFIGVSPMDFDKHVSRNPNNEFVSVNGLKQTVRAIKQEVKNIEEQGVDKIVLLAHTGQASNDYKGVDLYKVFAKIGGIDVIVGGHDHLMVDRWENSSRTKIDNPNEYEPVRIVSTGSDNIHYFSGNLNLFGTMNLTFDDDGVLIPEKCRNKIKYTHTFPKSNFIGKYLDKDAQRVVGVIPFPIVTESDPLCNENKVANFVADSDFRYACEHTQDGNIPDFAFVNAGTIRDSFTDIEVTKNQIRQVLPFKESLVKAELTKKQIYDALTISTESTTYKKPTPGMMQVSHMTYQINPDYSISDVKILDDEGNVRYNLDEMDDDDTFTCVYDSFLMSGPNLLGCLKAEPLEDYNVTRAQALEEYLHSGDVADYMTDRIIIRS